MDDELELRLLEPGDKVTGLSLGHEDFQPLKTFLQKKAKGYQVNSFARTYCVFDGEKIAAYVTLICGEVLTETPTDVLEDGNQFEHRTFPAVKIARLAVDKRYRGRGLGEELVSFAIGIASVSIMPVVGCRFLVVDSKKSAVKFYEKVGFTLLDTPSNKALEQPVLFLDLTKI